MNQNRLLMEQLTEKRISVAPLGGDGVPVRFEEKIKKVLLYILTVDVPLNLYSMKLLFTNVLARNYSSFFLQSHFLGLHF